ncbi:formate--phosphoribosylaminoimidazolecarboxamide ligase family protein [Thermococcus thioreducens]|uniref:5-formaminoimidazole-4-carboxamide-1-(Beta)-D-ribofuranosyl 5'-monophosphate synthetase n=1 Tax=Thermococcus thioreducens TaxID=277988 RepID=A0A0Q2RF50_9EURY|nr:formate--phosphoribosylaminoimidazolecarboxamide ligase family protein [Thermococcus thioreducens]ASJ11623.1 5-formaminoimidazole-4-carboxamide-1-(beta)-D-ribofuranosyl 5'-monophosphate synthetase [Thermococcus thioreducens]KQH82638.1 5-formaminoimidazole-4-carboxamide-1-(beta)-D-ribofuranosyl 5'-monophosphate synthetase [Thermococcus thioreducens]SEW16730.1 5-formaminoimidazole-4-carboxamide-1-(beta)-D-ribofuranosyl 5'-monophosphate synthetase [Thermococcus thioreducens]
MISREEILSVLESYNPEKITVGVIGSHSALDIGDGAKEEGLPVLVVAQRGRHRTYAEYFKLRKTRDGLTKGFIDEVVVLEKFAQIIDVQDELVKRNVIFVPNRSFVVYTGIDRVENDFRVPLFGSRNLLRSEERGEEKSYYWLLERAGLPYPEPVKPEEIDEVGLVIVKLPHAKKRLERGFFTAASYKEFREKAEKLIKLGVITEEDLSKARIERYIIGPVFNFDFFYSPIDGEIELLGIDWRFETSLDGHVRLPAHQQLTLPEHQFEPEYTVTGHASSTLRESLLEKVFDMAESYVKATQKYYPPGIIGPFTLQTAVDKDLNFYIYDVAPRTGGGTNIHMAVGHPYGNALWRRPMSTGRRVALEIKRAIELDELEKVVT